MIRIAHLSDTHLGYRQGYWRNAAGRYVRALDFERATTDAFRSILAIHATDPFDLIVHSGDIFNAARPDMSAVKTLARCLRDVGSARIPMVLISGNHDAPTLRTPETTLSMLATVFPQDDGFYWAINRRREVFDIDTPSGVARVDCFPHGCLEDFLDLDIPPAELGATGQYDLAANIAVAHGTWSADNLLSQGVGHEFGDEKRGEPTIIQPSWTRPFDYVAMGHLHEWSIKGGVDEPLIVQAGSTERSGWRDERAEPGWVEVTLDPGGRVAQRHLISVRPFLDLGVVDRTQFDLPSDVGFYVASLLEGEKGEAITRVLVTKVDQSEHRSISQAIRKATKLEDVRLKVETETPYTRVRTGSGTVREQMLLDGPMLRSCLACDADCFAPYCATCLANGEAHAHYEVIREEVESEPAQDPGPDYNLPESEFKAEAVRQLVARGLM